METVLTHPRHELLGAGASSPASVYPVCRIQINAEMQVTDVNGIQQTIILIFELAWREPDPFVVPHACHKPGSATVNRGHS